MKLQGHENLGSQQRAVLTCCAIQNFRVLNIAIPYMIAAWQWSHNICKLQQWPTVEFTCDNKVQELVEN